MYENVTSVYIFQLESHAEFKATWVDFSRILRHNRLIVNSFELKMSRHMSLTRVQTSIDLWRISNLQYKIVLIKFAIIELQFYLNKIVI